MYRTARKIAAEGITITNGFQNLGHMCVTRMSFVLANGADPETAFEWSAWAAAKASPGPFCQPKAAPHLPTDGAKVIAQIDLDAVPRPSARGIVDFISRAMP